MDSLRGAAAVVTGASSGIGLAVAERFVGAGARVMTGSRSKPPEGLGRWLRTDVADRHVHQIRIDNYSLREIKLAAYLLFLNIFAMFSICERSYISGGVAAFDVGALNVGASR